MAGGTIVFALYAGTTTFTVTDATGATVTDSVSLTEPLELISTTTWSPILCYGGTSTITTSATGGTAPYGGITTTTETAGTYEYVLADANGCRVFDTVTIVQPAILDATATPDPILCYGDLTDVLVVATGGTAPYPGPCSTYQYGEVEDYTIFIQDDNGGIGSMQTVIGQNQNGDLKQGNTALDNVKSYEDVVNDTEVGGIGLEVGDIYPNPVLATNGEFNLQVRIGHKSDVTVRIVDLSGKVVLTDLMHLETGANKRSMYVTGFAKGSYLIEVISGDLKETTQLIVQ
ncbi:MAG: T9SS type A sorting domain-containing protein [Crocinitomicaceae bacterium]|nr:T9SS type A sorting domain-containing protein [Crocinitomicaceae bacterium]